MGSHHRHGDSRAVECGVEDFLRLLDAFWGRAELEHVPGLLRAAGVAPGAEPARGRVGRTGGALAGATRQRGLHLRAEELLLSGLAEGGSDFAVRPAFLGEGWAVACDRRARGGRARARVAADADTHHAPAPRR